MCRGLNKGARLQAGLFARLAAVINSALSRVCSGHTYGARMFPKLLVDVVVVGGLTLQ
jgi:hypothetical protein